MHRVSHILDHLSVNQCSYRSDRPSSYSSTTSQSTTAKKTTTTKTTTTRTNEITSLDVFLIMNAVLNGGKGGAIDERSLKDENKLKMVFEKLDLNSSGDLDRNEFGKAARLCSMVITDDEIDSVYNQMAKGSAITFEQFKNAITLLVDSLPTNNAKFQTLDEGTKTVIALWDQYMNGNKYASNLFTSNLLREPCLKTLKNVNLDKQVYMIFGMISNAIRGLFDEDKLLMRLEKEGQRHYYTFGITETHYKAVTKALFDTLPVVIGKDYNFYAQMQFEKHWEMIKNAMLKGYGNTHVVL